MLLSILVSILHSTIAFAGTTVELSESYAGNLSFVLTAGSFRTQSNSGDHCDIATTSNNSLSGIPNSATVVKAYLYWAGSSYNGDIDTDITLNGFPYTADRTYIEVKDDRYFYNGIKDITSYVNSNKNINYEVGDLDIADTGNHCSIATVLGGWAILAIYEDDAEDFRVLNLYEGFEFFQNRSFDLIPNNFKLPNSPSGKHAHITWEGDDSLGTDGEFLAFEGVTLTDSGNPSNNQFNSYSNVQGGLTTYGVDVDEYDISAYLVEGDEEVTTTYSAGQDLIILSAEIISVSNIPVADLGVTTSTPTGWQANSTVTKKFTISNNGPNDVPTESVRFTTSLPPELTFNGVQGDSDWLCSQTGQDLSCVFQSKLRSGWSDYLDLTFDVGNFAGTTVDMDVSVDHDTAPYDIFDNQDENDTYSMSVPVATDPVIDLSASSKVPDNLNGDLLLAGDTLQYTITIDDASDLAVSNIQVTDDLPANITAFRVTAIPTGATDNSLTNGGVNSTGYLDIQNISLAIGATEKIIIEVDIDPSAADGASLQNQATITQGTDTWLVDTGDITVVEPDLSSSAKDALDVNGGWLLPNETARYTITLDDAKDLDLTGLQITDHLPANISSFTVSNLPTGAQDYSVSNGGNNSTGYIDIRSISLDSGTTLDIYIDVTVDSDAPDQADLTNSATVTLNNATWDITSNELKVSLTTSTPASGNKPLYFDSSSLSRNIPTANVERTFSHNESLTWTLESNLQSDLTLAIGEMDITLAVQGYRTGSATSDFDIELFYNDNISSGEVSVTTQSINSGNYRQNATYDVSSTLTLAAEVTIPAGSSIYLVIDNTSSNGSTNQNRDLIGIRSANSANGTFDSKIVLNASTVINVDSITVWDATYGDPTGTGDGNVLANSQPDTNLYIRAVISDPFGAFDISSADINIVKTNGDIYDFSAHSDGNTNIMNQVDDTADDLTTNSKTYEKEITLLEEDESVGYWAITIKGYEGMEVAPDQVTHESLLSFQIKPFLPSIALIKSITVISDPINGTTNPKAIPGAELTYGINAINSGRGKSDDGSLILQDEIPVNSDLYVGTITCSGTDLGPVCFKEGATPNESGLSFVYVSLTDASDDLFFSTDGSDFTYDPVDSGDGYDPAIRYIRIAPANELNNAPKDASAQPEFNFYYQIRLN
ncbi:MAG: hypothetical protein V7785_15300 [Bermanella sp.]